MKTLSAMLGFLALAGVVASTPAAELSLEGSRLVVSGMLDGSVFKEFESQLAGGTVRTVVFENSMGGSPEVAADYARAIQATGVNTEARGQCQGACAFAFLAGKEHRFGHGLQVHALLIPVGERPQPGDLANRWQGPAVYRTLAEFTSSASGPAASDAAPRQVAAAPAPASPAVPGPPTLVAANGSAASAGAPAASGAAGSEPRERWQPDQGVLFTSTPTLFGRVNNSFYCDGTQGRDMSRCEVLPGTDPYKLGVLTP